MMVKEGYKQVRVGPQQMEIPENWTVNSLSDAGQFINGKAFKPSDWKDKGLPIIRIQNLNDINAEYNYYEGDIEDKYIIKNGDILLSWSASLGAYKWKRGKAVLNQHIFKVETKKNIDKEFFYQMLIRNVEKLVEKTHGSTMKHIRKKELDLTYFPLPPLREQKKIAAILFSVDEAIEKTDEIIEGTKQLKKGLMQNLLTRGIGHSEFIKTQIGELPFDWKLKSIDECVHVNREGLSSKTPKDYIIEYIDISSIEETGIISNTTNYLYKEAPSRAKRKVHKGDVILSTVRPYLKAFAVIKQEQENLICSTGFAVLTPKNTIDSFFLYYYICSDKFINYLKRLMIGTNYPAVNNNDVKIALIPLPPLEEQKKIASILSSVDKKIQKEQEYKEQLEQLKKGLMQKLLTGEVRVKVDEEE